jgi:hypothetical protein
MTQDEILNRVSNIRAQIDEGNMPGALGDLEQLEMDLVVATEQEQREPMTPAEEDKNAGVTRNTDGSIKTVMNFADARDHHLIRQNYRRMVGLDK